jgi:hypothetical protein
VNGEFAFHVRAAARRTLGDRGRAFVRRAELATGLRPRVNQRLAHTASFPENRKAAVVIVADFELAWAWRYARMRSPLAEAHRKAANGRRNVQALLDLCDTYGIPITWDTVGHLMLNGCERIHGRSHDAMPRVPYFTNERWSYRAGDWFDDDPAAGADEPEWFAWYAPDLVQEIILRPTQHEIGSHSFSHIPFAESICPAEVAHAELQLCRAAASESALDLRTFAFPGNIAGHFDELRAAGFTSYRSVDMHAELDLPHLDPLGLWAIPAGLCLDRADTRWTGRDEFDAARRYIDLALETGLMCNFWFHPEMDPRHVDTLFPMLLEYLAAHRSQLWLTTSSGAVEWFESLAAETTSATSSGRQPAPSTGHAD